MGKDKSSTDPNKRPAKDSARLWEAKDAGKRGTARDAGGPGSEGRPAALPDFLRRLLALGLSGFFTTEEALRRALGDTLPQDWIDFASQQSERTRGEMMDRLASEFGRVIQSTDLVELAERLLEGRTIEVTARIRIGEREPGRKGAAFELQVAGSEKGKR